MEKVILISEKYLKNYSTFDLNIDSSLLMSSILFAQEMNIESLVGTDLLNEILTQYSGGTLNTDNNILLENYIKPALAAYSVYEVSDFLLFHFSNKSIEKLKSDTSDPVSLAELNHLKGKLLNRAEFLGEKLSKFLIANTTTYPLYLNGNNTVDKLRPNFGDIGGNIYIPSNSMNRDCSRGQDLPE